MFAHPDCARRGGSHASPHLSSSPFYQHQPHTRIFKAGNTHFKLHLSIVLWSNLSRYKSTVCFPDTGAEFHFSMCWSELWPSAAVVTAQVTPVDTVATRAPFPAQFLYTEVLGQVLLLLFGSCIGARNKHRREKKKILKQMIVMLC